MIAKKSMFIFALLGCVALANADFRKWTNAQGDAFVGELVEQEESRVLIRREADLRAFWVLKEELSAEDQAYLKEVKAERNEVNSVRIEVTALNRSDETTGWEFRYLTPIEGRNLPEWFVDHARWGYSYYWGGTVKTSGRLLKIEATSIEGDVECLFQVMFFAEGGRLYDRRVFPVKVEFMKGTLAVGSTNVHDYYGWAVVVRRFNDGKVLAIEGYPKACIDLAKGYL